MSPSEGASAERLLLGILALLAADRDDRREDAAPRKTEVVLADAGFSLTEIASLLGKNRETVKSTVRRARGSTQPS